MLSEQRVISEQGGLNFLFITLKKVQGEQKKWWHEKIRQGRWKPVTGVASKTIAIVLITILIQNNLFLQYKMVYNEIVSLNLYPDTFFAWNLSLRIALN